MGPTGDTNVGFTLTMTQRQQVGRTLESLVDGLPRGSSVLIDRAGHIVEVARKPTGVDLPAISALAAGCFATTHELASAMGEDEYSLLFQHENDDQVFVTPVVDRALLVVIMRGAQSVEAMEQRLGTGIKSTLDSVIGGAAAPPRNVPPPRIVPMEVPNEVRQRMRALTGLIMDLQAKRPKDFTNEINRGLLVSREQLVQTLSRRDWRKAWELIEGTRQWLLNAMHVTQTGDVGVALVAFYVEVFAYLQTRMEQAVSPDRLRTLFLTFHRFLSRKHPRVFVTDRVFGATGVDVQELWKHAKSRTSDSMQLATEFVPGMDALVRELLRVIYLSKGNDGRQAAMEGATVILRKYTQQLLPFGLEGIVGRDWFLLPGQG